jgi:hypothetical protein
MTTAARVQAAGSNLVSLGINCGNLQHLQKQIQQAPRPAGMKSLGSNCTSQDIAGPAATAEPLRLTLLGENIAGWTTLGLRVPRASASNAWLQSSSNWRHAAVA